MCRCCCSPFARLERTILASEARIIAAINAQTAEIIAAIQACCDEEIPHWRANVDYQVSDLVRKGNDIYECIQANRSNGRNKPPNSEYWNLSNV